jgi:hypothetical protein
MNGNQFFGWLREDEEGLPVLYCWVNGALPSLKTRWSHWLVSQRLRSSSNHLGRGTRHLRGANRSDRYLELASKW